MGTSIWCDTPRAPGVCVLSRADAGGGGTGIVASTMTARLLAAAGHRTDVLAAPFGRIFTIGPARVELYASGLMPGASSACFDVAGERLVYAGAVGLANAELRQADVVCVYAPAVSATANFVPARFVADESMTCVFLAPGLAEAFALAQNLAALGVCLRAPARLCRALRILGAAVMPFRGTPRAGEAVVWPLSGRRSAAVTRIQHARTIVLPEIAASGDRLVDYVIATGATTALLLGAGTAQALTHFRSRGIDARPLHSDREQLGLFAPAAEMAASAGEDSPLPGLLPQAS